VEDGNKPAWLAGSQRPGIDGGWVVSGRRGAAAQLGINRSLVATMTAGRWRSALVLVQPETVVRWHCTWLRRRWAQRSGTNRAGRPPLDPHVARLLTDMAGANPLWGAPRIHGELRDPSHR
jgi:hypothetical protein